MKPPVLILCLTLLVPALPLFSQDSGAAPDAQTVFVLQSFEFDIKGRTRPDALLYVGDIKEGHEITGRENLEKYVRDKTQLLLNQRVLARAEINHTVGNVREDGKYPVTLFFIIEDTWNIIAVPYPKYDTNTGFELIIKARDYNFLGTMNPLRIDLGYKYDQNNRSSLVLEIDSNTPFQALGYNWNINFDHFLNYRTEAEEPFYYRNVTGLSMELPVKTTTFTFGFEESFIVNEENADRYKIYGNFQKGLYMVSRPYVNWKIPTGLEISEYGELTYTPGISATFNHGFPDWPLHDFRRGPFMNLSHNLGFNRINWIGNFRKGLDAAFNNSYNFDFHRLANNQKVLSIDYSVSGIGHFIITEGFGLSTYARFRHWFYHDPDYHDQAGDALRGVLDKAVHAEYMLSLNLDFPIRILRFLPSQWFNTAKLRFFDFEMHLSPIIDMAFYKSPPTGNPLPETSRITFDNNNILISGGLEVIVFPGFMRSLYIRVSAAWNFLEQINNPGAYYLNPILPIVPHLPAGDNREIFIGIGHHY